MAKVVLGMTIEKIEVVATGGRTGLGFRMPR